jgi:hypothetical protein
MNNYNTKYAMGEEVFIKVGLYRGRKGIVEGYMSGNTIGLNEDNGSRGIKEKSGLYEIKLSFFKTIYAQEFQLELFSQKDSP